MKIQYTSGIVIFLFLLISSSSFVLAQGDNPCSATVLTVGTSCSLVNGNNTGATNSTVPDANCDGANSNGDVWYTALVGSGGDLNIITTSGTLTDIGMAVYTGSSCSSLSFHSCIAGGSPGFPNMPAASLTGLTPGSEVWIRLWDVDNDETGSFNICVFKNCNASVTITGSTSGCSANPTQICATAGFSSYSWSTGGTLSCINVSSTANYTVTATDANGCTATDSHSFTALISPTVSITGPSSACSADNPQLCVPAGFTNYNWTNGGSSTCISPVSSNTYSVTVTAANGCTASSSKAFTMFTSPSVSVTGPPSKCSNGSQQLCVPAGYSDYSWSNGGTSACISPASTGTYTVLVTDVNNCTASASHAITVQTAPSVSVSGPSTECLSANPQLCVAGGFSSYSWSSGQTTNCISPTTTGNYIATVTDGFGCTGSSSKFITINPSPSFSITGPSSACSGTAPQLCTPGGYSVYSWSNGGTTNCINPASTGNYTVIITDANGCTASNSHSFTLEAPPNSTITGPSSTCNGASGQLCAQAGNTFYLWSNGSNSSCITTSTSGTYSVVVTGSNGCTSSSSHSLTVFQPYAMTVTGPSTACSGTNPQLCATSGSYTYQWSTGATTACINPSVSGTYTVVSTNSNGCTRTASKGLTVFSPLNATISGPTSACTGSVVSLCGPSGSSSYTWSNGQTTECINVNSNGVYSVTISDINGCTASASQPVVFSSSFNINISGPPSGCTGSFTTLCVPSGYASYAWNTGGTAECISVNSPGTYSVTVHDQVGCVANNFLTLNFNPPPFVNITGPTIICAGSLANWCATPGYVSYLWSNGGTSECVNVSADTIYSVEVTDTNGCTGVDSSPLVVVQFSPNIIESNGLLICDTVNPVYTYSWLLNGLPTNCTGDTCTPTFSGTYSVIVTDTTVGCSQTATYNYINVGIYKSYVSRDIILYPNPFYGNELTIDFRNMSSEKITLDVYDPFGKLIYYNQFMVESDLFSKLIFFPENAAGIYFVRVKTKDGVQVSRIVKQ